MSAKPQTMSTRASIMLAGEQSTRIDVHVARENGARLALMWGTLLLTFTAADQVHALLGRSRPEPTGLVGGSRTRSAVSLSRNSVSLSVCHGGVYRWVLAQCVAVGELLGYARVSTTVQDPALEHDALRAAGCRWLWTDTASGRGRTASRQGPLECSPRMCVF